MKRLLYILLFLPLFAHGQYYMGQKAAGGGGGPLPTTNLWAYFEADNAASITQTSNAVGQWNDLSGNAHHLVQATTANKPDWNGSNTITFTASASDNMKIATVSLTQPVTIYAVIALTSSTNGEAQLIFGDAAGFTKYAMIYRGASSVLAEISASSTFDGATAMTSGTFYLVKFVFNNASSSIQVNNNTATSGSIGTASAISTAMTVGAYTTNNSTMALKGLYIYQNGSPVDADVKSYTTSKWGLP